MSAPKQLETERIYCIGSPGLVSVGVCAPKDTPREDIEAWVNGEHPTGISSPWAVSDEAFAGGEANPCPCDQEPETRLHYLLTC
jgi:hypothetical protein